ncbi:MAG: ferredoxin [Candidatus Marinimicrobia bacterium]|nr:ferredoxin [Candidatus Neomarinimicrobiota bacterium]
MKRYNISEECIGCRACVEVAGENFVMNDTNKAYIKKQPESDNEALQCEKALNVCPVNAIHADEVSKTENIAVILGSSNIKATLEKHPELKDVLIDFSQKFKRMLNPALFNTLARFASFNDAAKVSEISICEILHTINKFLGIEDKLLKSMPKCIQEIADEIENKSVALTWNEITERYIYNNNTIDELIQKVSNLAPQQNIVIISEPPPNELLKVADGLDLVFNINKDEKYRISFFNPRKAKETIPWQERKNKFETLDVRTMKTDPFDIIIKKAYAIKEDSGFVLIQRFEPHPLINMLSEMGFEHVTEQRESGEFWIYLYKIISEGHQDETSSSKIDVVIQSATPVAYPVIMRLLQSKKIREHINIKELKVWEETEKHLAWITNGKADISFSALITSAKLRNSDIKIPALFVWDNFVLLSRCKADSFEDIIGKEIYTPLFEEAPPAKITKYLIKASDLDPNDFKFVFGKPFGRPEEIYIDFISGKADTVILREPEASYAIKVMQDRNTDISVISYNEIWNKINPGFGSFPNAGVVLKGEFTRKHPELTKVFLEELKSSIEWVNKNKKASAELSFDMMRQPVDRIELFLDRVNFNYVDGKTLTNKVKQYFDTLNQHDIVEMNVDEDFLNIFKI